MLSGYAGAAKRHRRVTPLANPTYDGVVKLFLPI